MSDSIKQGIVRNNLVETKVTEETKKLQKFLQFEVNYNTSALLPAESVTEIITISESEILPVPQMPDCVMGIYSWRSEMLWIIDLRNLLGYEETDWKINANTSPQPALISGELSKLCKHQELELDGKCCSLMAIAIEFEGKFLGFCVHKINDILELDPQEINSECREIFSSEIIEFLQGYFIDRCEQILMILKTESLFSWEQN